MRWRLTCPSGDWGAYTVPDAAQINAEIGDPYRGMTPEGRVSAMQIDRLRGGAIGGIATGVSIQLGAGPATQDLVYGLGSAGDGLVMAYGGVRGAQFPGVGNQLELRLPQNVGINGNSKLSPRTAYLYELSLKDGTFLKNGVTQNLDTRYTKSFMADKDIYRVAEGPRADMLALERQITIANPGPLNNEPWAVKARRGN